MQIEISEIVFTVGQLSHSANQQQSVSNLAKKSPLLTSLMENNSGQQPQIIPVSQSATHGQQQQMTEMHTYEVVIY